MTSPLSAIVAWRLEKAAVDNGFDQELPCSPHEDGTVDWLGTLGDAGFLAAFSQQNVAWTLADFGTVFDGTLPAGAIGA